MIVFAIVSGNPALVLLVDYVASPLPFEQKTINRPMIRCKVRFGKRDTNDETS